MEKYFEYLNQYYDKIYVVSVQAASARRTLFTQRFTGLDYSFFFGADKANFKKEELIKQNIYSEDLTRKHHRYSKGMLPGEIACAWSHKMIYEEMLLKQYNRILVFEDDAVPDPEIIKKVPEVLSETPDDCELLFWGWSKYGEKKLSHAIKLGLYHFQYHIGLLKWNNEIIKNLFAKPYSQHLKIAGFHDYTFAYAISKRGAEKLLKMQTPIQYVADNLLAHACTKKVVNGYIVYPPAFLHDTKPDGTQRDSYIR